MDELKRLRFELAQRKAGTAQLTALIEQGVSHGWYENFAHFAGCVAKVVDPKFYGFTS